MAQSEFRTIQLEQRKLDAKLDLIAAKRAREWKAETRVSYCMHTPKEALRRLGERARSRY